MALTKVSYSMIIGACANVLDYGAVADYDGSTGKDNTEAFQAAIDSGAATVYIPAGSYYVPSSLVLPTSGVTIVGEGRTKSVLYGVEHTFITTDVTSDVRLKSFGMWGPSYYGTSNYAIFAEHDIINFLVEDVAVQRGHGFLKAQGAGSTDIVKLDVRDCYFYGSSSYAIHIGAAVSMNSLSFENTWFDLHGVSAIRSEGSLATGYARFESCIFESNRGQYSIYLANAQAIFNNCVWYNNGLHLPADPAITNGVDVYLEQGNQQITKFEGCSFGPPTSDAVDWTSIFISQSEANLVSVENCYGNGDGVTKYFIVTNSPNPASLSVKASRWLDYTASAPILGVGVDMVNNLPQNGQSVVNNQIASLTTTNDVTTKIWGGTN